MPRNYVKTLVQLVGRDAQEKPVHTALAAARLRGLGWSAVIRRFYTT